MIRNYIQLAWKVLNRRKFFTFVSLFGISFTLLILIVIVSFWESTFGTREVEKNMDRALITQMIYLEDTVNNNYSNGTVSYYYLNTYVKTMQTPEKVGIYTMSDPAKIYSSGNRFKATTRNTDAAYFEIFDFDFLYGRAYTEQEVEMGQQVGVISRRLAEQLYGTTDAAGREFEIFGKTIKISGVIENVSISRIITGGDVFLPYKIVDSQYDEVRLNGRGYGAVMLGKTPADRELMKEEYAHQFTTVQWPADETRTAIYGHAESPFEDIVRMIFGNAKDQRAGKLQMWAVLVLALFLLLPTINLVNMTISRTIERAGEIGIRKAFGASSRALVGQFLVENIVTTFIGGIFGLLLTTVVISLLNDAKILSGFILRINGSVLLWTVLITLGFGVISGVYPAWRMSRMEPVEALKSEEQ